MTINRKKILQFWIGSTLFIGLVSGVIIHEFAYEGSQSELFFPSLQKRKAFELITALPYEEEKIYFFEWGSDLDSDAWYYLAAEIDRNKLNQILKIKSATASPFDAKSYRWWRFPGINKPEKPEYYTTEFSRKGHLHIWYNSQDQILYLVDEWIG